MPPFACLCKAWSLSVHVFHMFIACRLNMLQCGICSYTPQITRSTQKTGMYICFENAPLPLSFCGSFPLPPCSHHFHFPLCLTLFPPHSDPLFLPYLPTPSWLFTPSLLSLSSSLLQLLELNCLGLYWTTFAQSLASLSTEEMVVSGVYKLSCHKLNQKSNWWCRVRCSLVLRPHPHAHNPCCSWFWGLGPRVN